MGLKNVHIGHLGTWFGGRSLPGGDLELTILGIQFVFMFNLLILEVT